MFNSSACQVKHGVPILSEAIVKDSGEEEKEEREEDEDAVKEEVEIEKEENEEIALVESTTTERDYNETIIDDVTIEACISSIQDGDIGIEKVDDADFQYDSRGVPLPSKEEKGYEDTLPSGTLPQSVTGMGESMLYSWLQFKYGNRMIKQNLFCIYENWSILEVF